MLKKVARSATGYVVLERDGECCQLEPRCYSSTAATCLFVRFDEI